MADREGRLEDRPKKIKIECFPADNVDCAELLDELEEWNLISRYEEGGKKYVWIPTFRDHQKPHPNEKQSEIPPHPKDKKREKQKVDTDISHQGNNDFIPRCEASITKDVSAREKVITDPADILNPDIINTNYVSNEKAKAFSCLVSQETPDQKPPNVSEKEKKPVIEIPLKTKNKKTGEPDAFPIFQKDVDAWNKSFPDVNVLQELRAIREWNISANVSKRKTKQGIRKHITNWLAGEQKEHGHRKRDAPSARDPSPPLLPEQKPEGIALLKKIRGLPPNKAEAEYRKLSKTGHEMTKAVFSALPEQVQNKLRAESAEYGKKAITQWKQRGRNGGNGKTPPNTKEMRPISDFLTVGHTSP